MLADAHGTRACTSASASAACSAATRRSSRRRRRRCSTREQRARYGALAVATAQAVGYTGAGTVEFIVAGRRRRRAVLHGDEHPAAGRAPGHRAGHRPRPRRAAAAGRRRGAAGLRAGRRAPRPGTPSRRASTPRTPRAASCRPAAGCCCCASRPARACASTARCCQGGRRRHDVRPDAQQGHRLGRRPADRARPARPRAGRHRGARRRHQRRLPARAAAPPRRPQRARSTPGSSSASSTRWSQPRRARRRRTSPSRCTGCSTGSARGRRPVGRADGWRPERRAPRPAGTVAGPDGERLPRRGHRHRAPAARVRVGDGEPPRPPARCAPPTGCC